MLREQLITFDELERFFEQALPLAPTTDIDPQEFQDYFDELRRRTTTNSAGFK